MNVIEIKNLSKYYGKARGIIDVSFDVKEGEIFGFIGPNGSGKSTTIRTLLKLIAPTSGSATIFNSDITKDDNKIMANIGYVPSEVFYYDNMKVIELLNYSASFYKKDCSKRMYELASLFELDLNKKIEELSYGNKKKVGIVQALLHEPRLLILDEPTSGLDPLMQQKFFELLKEENKKGVTIFFSSHVLSEVQKLCDRVGIIKEGRVVKIETIHSLRSDNYRNFKIEFVDYINNDFFDIPGITNLSKEGNSYSFIFKGNINDILLKLVKVKVRNLLVTEPDLEDIFMHYYRES